MNQINIPLTIGERITDLRHERGLTQIELAKETGISKTLVSYYETDKCAPTLERLCILADYFHVTSDYLLGRFDAPVDFSTLRLPLHEGETYAAFLQRVQALPLPERELLSTLTTFLALKAQGMV